MAGALSCALGCPAAYGQLGNPGDFRTSPQAGFPRSWEAGVTVSPHSVVNLFNGNTATELLLMTFGSAGPPMRFSLCHYHFLGASSGGNSNGGAYNAIRLCHGSGYTRPPCAWLLYAWGWSNIGMSHNTSTCPGYNAD